MQSAATIHDAARRLEDAAAIFRFKSRNALDEYEELGGHWTDSRAQQFTLRHLQPQRETIGQGARLCVAHADLVRDAHTAADTAESELTAFYSAQQETESAIDSASRAAQSARELASRANARALQVAGEAQSLLAAIAAISSDPGW